MTETPSIDHISNDQTANAPVSFDFDRQGGMIRNFTVVTDSGAALKPLHTAPWAIDPIERFDDVPLVEQKLSGDFFCAPFGGGGDEPIHGNTANGLWNPVASGEGTASNAVKSAVYQLRETVKGAVVTKQFDLHADSPMLYQRHQFHGGDGHLPVGHHAMICVPGGARLSFSEKQFTATPAQAPESDSSRGRSLLKYPQKTDAAGLLETQTGERVDISRYPFAEGHEDLVIKAEIPSAKLGWTAALAQQDGFLFFAIKDATILPETLLWMSNGGRDYAPWLSRHRHVLGVEEVTTSCHNNGTFSSAAEPSPYGLPQGLTLSPDGVSTVNYAFGAIAPPSGWTRVSNIEIRADHLVLSDVGGDTCSVPFHGAHFGL